MFKNTTVNIRVLRQLKLAYLRLNRTSLHAHVELIFSLNLLATSTVVLGISFTVTTEYPPRPKSSGRPLKSLRTLVPPTKPIHTPVRTKPRACETKNSTDTICSPISRGAKIDSILLSALIHTVGLIFILRFSVLSDVAEWICRVGILLYPVTHCCLYMKPLNLFHLQK